MKRITTIFLSILLSFQASYGQENPTDAINHKWANLTTELKRRADVAKSWTMVLSGSKKMDKEELSNTRLIAEDLFNYLDTVASGDSAAISLASEKNSRLTQALSRTLVSLEKDKKFLSDSQTQGITTAIGKM